MISRENSGGYERAGTHPWSDDRTTTKYEPAQLRYLQRRAHARSLPPPPPPPLRAARPANQVEPELGFSEITERTENPFVLAHAEAKAGFFSVGALMALFAAVLCTRVLLFSVTGPERVAAQPSVPVLAPPSAASTEPVPAPAALPQPEPATQPPSAAGSVALHKSVSKHIAHTQPSKLEAEPNPEPAPRVPPPVEGFGTLRINTRPWSQVFVDGRLLGNTPQLGVRLPAGKHTLRLVNPEFNMTKTITVDLGAGENLSRVETLED